MSVLRIIGGTAARRRLRAPRTSRVRPTTDRVKETLFNILGERVGGSHFLDLFAGSGSIGLEACSRGAAHVTLVESAPAVLRCLSDNARSLGMEHVELRRARLPGGLSRLVLRGAPFGIAFLDPPYDTSLVQDTLAALSESGGLLTQDCLVVAQHESRLRFCDPVGRFVPVRDRVVGSSTLTFFRDAKAPAVAGTPWQET